MIIVGKCSGGKVASGLHILHLFRLYPPRFAGLELFSFLITFCQCILLFSTVEHDHRVVVFVSGGGSGRVGGRVGGGGGSGSGGGGGCFFEPDDVFIIVFKKQRKGIHVYWSLKSSIESILNQL